MRWLAAIAAAAGGTRPARRACWPRRSRASGSRRRSAPCRGTAAARRPRGLPANEPKAVWIRAELSSRLPCVIITPLGAAVEPEVYWRKASVPAVAPGSIHRPANSSSSEPSSVQSTSTPSSSGTPAAHRAASFPWEAACQDRARPGVGDDGPQPRHRPVEPGQMSGDGHDSGIEAAEERRDELEPGRVEQQGRARRRPAGPATGTATARARRSSSPRVNVTAAPVLAVGEKGKQVRVGYVGGATTEEIDQASPIGLRSLGVQIMTSPCFVHPLPEALAGACPSRPPRCTPGTPPSAPPCPRLSNPAGGSRSANQIEYCSSSFTTTLYILISSLVIVLSLLVPRHAHRAIIPSPPGDSSPERGGDVPAHPRKWSARR